MYGEPPSGPQYPQYPQQPPYGQQPPRRRKAWPWVLLGCGGAVLLVVVLGVACTSALLSGAPESAETTTGQQEGAGEAGDGDGAESVGVGEPGTVGQWQVTVNGIETAVAYGSEFAQEQAQGEFRIVNMTVENTGNEATFFDSSAVTLVDAEGNTYASSTMLEDDSLFLEQINPGNQAVGEAVFDVPEGTEITEVRVEDALSSEGPLVVRVE